MDALKGVVLLITNPSAFPMHELKLSKGRYMALDMPGFPNWQENKIDTVAETLRGISERTPVALLMELNYVQNTTDHPLMQNETRAIFEQLHERHAKLALITDAFTKQIEGQINEFWGDPPTIKSIREPLKDIRTEMDELFQRPGMGEAGPGTTAK